jgi:hypothetical protein
MQQFSGSQQHLFGMEQKSASLMHKRSASLMCNERTSDNVTNTPHTIHKSQLLNIWPQNTKHQSQRTWSKPQITKLDNHKIKHGEPWRGRHEHLQNAKKRKPWRLLIYLVVSCWASPWKWRKALKNLVAPPNP